MYCVVITRRCMLTFAMIYDDDDDNQFSSLSECTQGLATPRPPRYLLTPSLPAGTN